MRKTSLVLAALLAVAGICVMLWPVFTGHRLQSSAATAVQEFLADRDEPEQQYPELLAALQEYNRQLYAEKQCNLTDLEACEEPTADLTAYGIEDEIIGVLEIPTMELTMPVYLGASDAHLAAGAAVLGSTSAPIGGDSTNCVIAGHRGWRGADYFRHIDKLAVGDEVRITNLWETLTYTVADIQIIGEIKGADVILVDDMVDTAGTITKAANLMKEKGAASVRAVATHCIMSGPASERVQDSALEELVFTDSIPYSSRCAKVKQISIADILAETIRRVENNESISSQYLI